MSTGVTIRNLDRAQLEMMLDWAADEGWNPGLHDAVARMYRGPALPLELSRVFRITSFELG